MTAAPEMERDNAPFESAAAPSEAGDSKINAGQSPEKRVDDLVARINARLARSGMSAGAPTRAAQPPANPYEDAAAVLAWYDPDRLRPLAPDLEGADRNRLIDGLASVSQRTTLAGGERQLTLRPEQRVDALRRLRMRGAIDTALSANERSKEDPMQRALDRALDRNSAMAQELDALSLADLKAEREVDGWLQAAGFEQRSRAAKIAARIDWLTLLEPFEHLAGKQFRGRQAELRRLRAFVGIVPPSTALEGIVNLANCALESVTSTFLGRSPSFAMVIWGPGGVGKSTLVARFILEHARAHEMDRFPFAYLDFDRSDVSELEPLTLLTEAIRQLGIEYPTARESCERLRHSWLARLAESEALKGRGDTRSVGDIRSAAIREAKSVLDRLDVDGMRPIVLVLDTFEEVQYLGEPAVEAIWRFLDELQEAIPRLRVVIAGRAAIDRPGVALLSLEAFDEESAIAFLAARNVTDADFARQIFRRIGGSPLSLRLVAELAPLDDFSDVQTRDAFLRKLSAQNIQRQLYNRVLKHIHDTEIRMLAHPGLVLRRVTPELIGQVLAEPCGLGAITAERAQELFAELGRERALVRANSDGVLWHQQSLRQLMLGPLRQDEAVKDKVRRIDEAAMQFYARLDGDVARAEEIYHRLWLDEPLVEIETRWRPGVGSHLIAAVSEFDARRRAFLAARLGLSADGETRAAARLEDWETIVAQLGSEQLKAGHLSACEALLAERDQRTSGSPLFGLGAELLVGQGRLDPAMSILDDGFKRAFSSGNTAVAEDLALTGAEFVIKSNSTAHARAAAGRLSGIEKDTPSAATRLESVAKRAFLADLGPDAADAELEAGAILALLQKVGPKRGEMHQAMLWAGAAPGGDAAQRVKEVVDKMGLPYASDASIRGFALALAQLDEEISRSDKRQQQTLAELFDVRFLGSRTESWSAYLLERVDARGTNAAKAAFELPRSFDKARLVGAVQRLMADALGIVAAAGPPSAASAEPLPHQSRAVLSEQQLKAIRDVSVGLFTREELHDLVLQRLNRNIDSYLPGNAGMAEWMTALFSAANKERWIGQLLSALLDARPGHDGLARAIAGAGISSIAGSANPRSLDGIDEATRLSIDLADWRGRLGQLERALCRIEVDGKVAGTGVLIGPDLLLTADAALLGAHDGLALTKRVEVRFDSRTDASGTVVSAGTAYPVNRKLLVSSSLSNGLGYAVLRVDGEPGAQPLGSRRAESVATLRRWVELGSLKESSVSPGRDIAVLQFADKGQVQLSTGKITDQLSVGRTPAVTIRYDAATSQVGIGGLCIDASTLQPIAMNIGPDQTTSSPKLNFGLLIKSVQDDLNDRGLGSSIRQHFA